MRFEAHAAALVEQHAHTDPLQAEARRLLEESESRGARIEELDKDYAVLLAAAQKEKVGNE